MKSRIALILIAATLAGCGGGYDSNSPTSPGGTTGGNNPTATTSVTMSGLRFNPSAISVSAGAVVTWTNNDNTDHNVTFDNSAVPSIGSFSSGSKTAIMPTAPATYSYHCTIHSGMTGTVTVQ